MITGDPAQALATIKLSDMESGIRSLHLKLYYVDPRDGIKSLQQSRSLNTQCSSGGSGCTCTPAKFCFKSQVSVSLEDLLKNDPAHKQKLSLEAVAVNWAGLSSTAAKEISVDTWPPSPGRLAARVCRPLHISPDAVAQGALICLILLICLICLICPICPP